jgi:2-haloacid dehalogenase
MNLLQNFAGIVCDAYGTLFDVYAIEAQLESRFPGKGRAIALRWRDKQIEYSRLRTMSGRYAGFWSVTVDALDYACEYERVALDGETRSRLLAQYERLPAHPEVPSALRALVARGLPLAVLSNANIAMLEAALIAAGLRPLFAHVLSVESVRKFKTAPEAYQLGPDAFGRPANELLFVSSNGWDAAGAAWFGYPAYWINRAGAPMERLDARPIATGRTMTDLVAFLSKHSSRN